MIFNYDFENVRAAFNLLFQLFLLVEAKFPNARKWGVALAAVAIAAVIGWDKADPTSFHQALEFSRHILNNKEVGAALKTVGGLAKSYRLHITGQGANQEPKELPEQKEK